jgi:hypothetical protein
LHWQALPQLVLRLVLRTPTRRLHHAVKATSPRSHLHLRRRQFCCPGLVPKQLSAVARLMLFAIAALQCHRDVFLQAFCRWLAAADDLAVASQLLSCHEVVNNMLDCCWRCLLGLQGCHPVHPSILYRSHSYIV